jgi:hypothetical protein
MLISPGPYQVWGLETWVSSIPAVVCACACVCVCVFSQQALGLIHAKRPYRVSVWADVYLCWEVGTHGYRMDIGQLTWPVLIFVRRNWLPGYPHGILPSFSDSTVHEVQPFNPARKPFLQQLQASTPECRPKYHCDGLETSQKNVNQGRYLNPTSQTFCSPHSAILLLYLPRA